MGSPTKLSRNDLLDRLPGRKPGPAERVEGKSRKTWQRAGDRIRSAGPGVRKGISNLTETATEPLRRRRRKERLRKRVGIGAAAATAAGAGAYFLDPASGKRRRHMARDRVTALVKRGGRKLDQVGTYGAHTIAGKAKGVAAGTEPTETPSDEALADRVRSEVFRPADAPKGAVNINVENGVVYLRGEVEDSKQIRKLVSTTDKVDGVKGVENLLSPA